MTRMEDCVAAIAPADARAKQDAQRLQDSLTKPRGSLGKLESLSVRLAGVYHTSRPSMGRTMVFTMAADHGVTSEGVSAYPAEVTRQMVLNFASGGAAINVLARHVGAEVRVVDMGVACDEGWPSCIIERKVARGTKSIARGPAMTIEDARRSIEAGIELAESAVDEGFTAIAIGDMGIGNTTAASAVTSVITGCSVRAVTGRGTGIDDVRLNAKVSVIERSIEINRPDPRNGVDVLAKVGGFELGGMAGVILGGSSKRVPVFIDGFVSGSAALIAGTICPHAVDYMVASHLSVEPGHAHALAHLGLTPVLDLEMRLGEGTGAVLAMNMAQASCKILSEMATFEGAGVSQSSERHSEERTLEG